MALAVYFEPSGLTTKLYDEIVRRLEAAGMGNPDGRLCHASFGAPDRLRVFDIWESQEDLDRFSSNLTPILNDLGVDPGRPAVAPVHCVIAQIVWSSTNRARTYSSNGTKASGVELARAPHEPVLLPDSCGPSCRPVRQGGRWPRSSNPVPSEHESPRLPSV